MRGFRKDIEGLRAVAVAAVVLFHAGAPGFGGGYAGVDVFFVISGFLITGQLLNDDEQHSALARIRRFYARRIRRILPAATLTIAVTLVAAALLQAPLLQRATRLDAISATFFFSNIRFADIAADYFHQGDAPSLFQHFWSLSVEEQFYVVWPALLVGTGLVAMARRRAARIVIVGGLLVVSLAASVALRRSAPVDAFYLLPTRAWELCAGALLAIIGRPLVVSTGVARLARAAGIALIVFTIATFGSVDHFPGYAATIPVFGTALVIAAGTAAADGGSGRLLSLAPMQLLGRYSYSVYLWHWPVLMLVATQRPGVLTSWPQALAVMVLGALPIAVASFHLVEHPFRTRFTPRPDRDAIVAGAAILAAGAVFIAGFGAVGMGDLDTGRPLRAAKPGDLTPAPFVPSNLRPSLVDAHEKGNEANRSCAGALQGCVLGDADATTTVVLYGDSHSLHWLGAFDAAGRARNWRVVTYVKPGCPSFVHPSALEFVNCKPFRDKANAFIAQQRPDLVVMSNSSLLAVDALGSRMRDGVLAAIEAIPVGVPVAVLSQTPAAGKNVPVCLSEHLHSPRRCEPRPDEPRVREVNDLLREALAGTAATLVEARPLVCDARGCPTVVGNSLVYRDDDHVTYDFARTRGAMLAAILTPLLPTIAQ